MQNDIAKLLLIAKFRCIIAKNTNTNHILFKLNYEYYSCIFFEKETHWLLKSWFDNKLTKKLKDMIIIC